MRKHDGKGPPADGQQDEREQFREFVAARSAGLFRVALGLAGTHHAAEDLLQGALSRTFTRWSQVRGNPEAYVRRAMYHAQISFWRRRGKIRELPTSELPDRPDAQDDMGATERRIALRRALLLLGPRQRAVLVARYLEDLSEEQTATLLGCSPGTVRSQTHRALTRLRELAPGLADEEVMMEAIP